MITLSETLLSALLILAGYYIGDRILAKILTGTWKGSTEDIKGDTDGA